MDKKFYIAAARREAAAFAGTMRRLPESRPVPSTPAWNSLDLLLHLGGVLRGIVPMLDSGRFSPPDPQTLKLPEEYVPWLKGNAPLGEPTPPALLEWFEEGAALATDKLEHFEPVENQFGGPFRDPFLFVAMEVTLHRWDAQGALPPPQPIEAELAYAALDYTLEQVLPMRRKFKQGAPANGETYHFHRTDGPGEWLVKFAPEGITVTREHAKGDMAVRGSASDLLLFVTQRLPADRLETFGDASLAARFFELVPPV